MSETIVPAARNKMFRKFLFWRISRQRKSVQSDIPVWELFPALSSFPSMASSEQ